MQDISTLTHASKVEEHDQPPTLPSRHGRRSDAGRWQAPIRADVSGKIFDDAGRAIRTRTENLRSTKLRLVSFLGVVLNGLITGYMSALAAAISALRSGIALLADTGDRGISEQQMSLRRITCTKATHMLKNTAAISPDSSDSINNFLQYATPAQRGAKYRHLP